MNIPKPIDIRAVFPSKALLGIFGIKTMDKT